MSFCLSYIVFITQLGHDQAMLAVLSPGVKNIILATIFFGALNALVKYVSYIPVVQILFFRSLVSLLISGLFLKRYRIQIFKRDNIFLLLLRGIAGALALIAYFTTIQHIPLASAVTILYLAPIFTVIFAIFINKEKPHLMQLPFMGLSLLGASLLKKSDQRIDLKYFAMGLFAAIFAGLAYNIIRKLKNRAHPQLIIFFFPLVTLPIVTPLMIKEWVTPTPLEFCILIGIGILTQIAQVFMTKAYMLAPASEISHYSYLTSIYAWLSGIVFFNEIIPIESILALGMIIIGVVLCTRYSAKQN